MITREMIKAITPRGKEAVINPLVDYLNEYMPKYGVTSYLRVCHFLAQAAHESDSFRTLREYATGAAYEGRKDLGNTQPGDGVRYRGRGIFQLTGRANYREIGKRLGVDLENNPALAETPEISVQTALEYWKTRNLSALADADDVEAVTKKINGGFNGLADRKKYLVVAKNVVPKNVFANVAAPVEKPAAPVNPITPAIVVAKKGDESPYVKDLQNMLIKKGAKIAADGAFGPKTEQAVRDFQQKSGLKVTGQIDTDTLNKLMV